MIFTAISLLLLAFYVLLILAYWLGWLLIRPFQAHRISASATYSVLVPARNEAQVIRKCLEDILRQDFDPQAFEVIVINDHSTDGTAAEVQRVITAFPKHRITLLDMEEDLEKRRLKKAAITYGITKATGRYIILTDADCEREKNWLAAIDAFIAENAPKMVYAPVVFKARTVFEKIQSLEFAGLVGIGGAAIRMKNPNMCSAANLVFEKAVFAEVGGYAGNDGLASGDDEFLLHKVFKHYPDRVHFLKSRAAVVSTSANASVRELASQRRRWVSKSTKYENRYITAILVAAYLFNLAVLLNLLFNPRLGLLMLGAKTLAEGFFLYSVLRFFKRTGYLLFLPLAELFHIIYVLIIGIWANMGTYTWKDRNLK